jgi:uncharacterized repeat protein (TIGR01451 family)
VLTDDPDVGGSADQTCTTLANANLSVTKSASSTVCAGSNITYTINFSNGGPDEAKNVTVSDPTPANTTLVSATPPMGWTRTDSVPGGGTGTITFTKSSVANAETAMFQIVVAVNGGTTNNTVINNTATTTSDTIDPNLANNSGSFMVTVKEPPTAATVGGPQAICALGTTTGLGGNTPVIGTGTWSIVTGGVTGTFLPTPNTPDATFTHTGGAGPITLRWTISNSPCADSFAEVTITVNPSPATPTITPTPASVCADSTGNQASGPGGATTYAWTISNGTITSAANIQTITYTAGASGNVSLNLTVTNASGCSASNSANVPINASPATPTITPSPSEVCANSTGNQASGPAGATTYAWTISNGTITSAANIQTITYTAGASGNVTLSLTVTNASGCSASNSANVPIKLQPVASVGPNQTIVPFGMTTPLGGNTPPSGATGTWTVQSGGTGTFSSVNSPSSTFTHTGGAGPITLRWTVTNPPCTAAFAELTITVGSAPMISCPTPITVNAPTGMCSASVAFNVMATGAPSPTIECKIGATTITSPHTFPLGATTVNCTATNGILPDAACSFTVTVNDAQTPVLTAKSPIDLWPPNHEYRTLTLADMVASVSDSCSTLSVNDVRIEKVTSDEPVNVKGNSDGETLNDIVIAGDCKSVRLRSERDAKKNGRVYKVTLRVRDAANNTARAVFRVTVPINQSGTPAVDSGVSYTVNSSCP